jgi:SAM-dependent methyltransferase
MEAVAELAPTAGCLLCPARELEIVFDLGRTGLANNLPTASELHTERGYPLRLARCPRCTHVQLADRCDPAAMFQHYLYMSSASSTLSAHLDSLAEAITAWAPKREGARSLDIGSNDGTLASHLASRGFEAWGIDPAANLAPVARSKGIGVEVDYFGRVSAGRLVAQLGPFDVLTATNSFPHVPFLDDFLAGAAEALAPGGVFVIEAHYLGDLVEQCAFDTIYHEHCHYWRLEPLLPLLGRHGLEAFDVERLPVHHGQLRIWIQHRGARPVEPRVLEHAAAERIARLHTRDIYLDLARRARAIRAGLRSTLDTLRASGMRIAGYGAPAKASTLAAWCGLGPDDLLWIADRNPLKHGRFTPRTHIPIRGVEKIAEDRPDALLLFAWNFATEVMAQLSAYRAAGGRFIIPVPEVKIVH